MTLDDIIQALESKGWGAVDFLTGETVIETAQLDKDINGDGGLTLSWKSTDGGVIPAGSTLLGYVMIEPYVPTLNEDGTYQWQPKFSEPAALLDKNYYSKDLVMRRADSILGGGSSFYDGEVVAVADTFSDLDNDTSLYDDGDLAIALDQRRLCAFAGGAWEDDSGPLPAVGDVYKDTGTGYRWAYTANGWKNIDIETASIYSHVFAGPVRTIVENMNIFIKGKMGNDWNIVLHDDEDNTLASTNILCTFDGTTIKGALEEVANKAGEVYDGTGTVNLYYTGVNLYYTGKTIHLGISNAYSADNYYNRFIVLGGTRNMAKRIPQGTAYAAITQRMHIESGKYRKVGDDWERVPDDYTPAEGEKVVTIGDGSIIDMRGSHRDSIVPMERFLVWDDIYPKLNLRVASVTPRLCYLLDDNGEKIPASDVPGADYKLYCKWYITLNTDASTQYFLDTRYIIQDRPLSVLFQSGPLTGREFEVVYYDHDYTVPEKDEDDVNNGHTPSRGEFRIILISEGDVLLPTLPATYDNGGMCPNVGDWVTLVNVAIEDVFKERAQLELLKKGYAMAELISSGKQASWNETRTAPDVITGETGDAPALGDSVGDVGDGYVVTGIETNLMTNETKYSWGTFKPRGLLTSSIDKIGSLSLSGGEATFAPLVSVGEGATGQVIYVGNDYTPNGDGVSQVSSGKGTSQSATTAIRQAGGNVNIKTVYKTIESMSGDGGMSNVFAGLATEIWNHRETLQTKWSVVTLYFTNEQPGIGIDYYQYIDTGHGITLTYNGTSVTNANLIAAFASVKTVIGDTTETTVTAANNLPANPTQYDLCIQGIYVTINGETIEGGIRAWLYDGRAWGVILTSTTALLDNNGEAIRMVVFGADTPEEWITASGVLTQQNFVEMFSVVQQDGKTLAESLFSMGILYHVEEQGSWRDVYYDDEQSPVSWKYSDDDTIYVAYGDADWDEKTAAIIPYSFSKMSADNIEFDGQTISLVSDYGVHFKDRSNTDALVVTGGGKVVMNDLSVTQIAEIGNVLTVGNEHLLLRRQVLPNYPPDTQLFVRTFKTVGQQIQDKITVALGMFEFGSDEPYATNSYLQMKSFKSDWTTDIGYIDMRCGQYGPTTSATYEAYARSSIRMGAASQENIRLLADDDDSATIQISVRGSFGIIGSNNTYLGVGSEMYPETFTTANGKTVTVIGGVIIDIR